MRIRHITGMAVSTVAVIGFGGTAFAGEWGGNGELITVNGKSVCAYSGRDQSDAAPNGEIHLDGRPDDWLWGLTPAKGRVQSPGQIVALFGSGAAGAPGEACRGNTGS